MIPRTDIQPLNRRPEQAASEEGDSEHQAGVSPESRYRYKDRRPFTNDFLSPLRDQIHYRDSRICEERRKQKGAGQRHDCADSTASRQLSPKLSDHASTLTLVAPNGWRLSGDGGEADGVRCSRGLGAM